MRIAALVLLGALVATPARALSIGPPGCHDFDRGLREADNAAVLRIVWAGETREEGGDYVTPLRAVVDEVASGRDLRRDQILSWENRVSTEAQDFWGQGRPYYETGSRRVATVRADGAVSLWLSRDFYTHNLRTCYRRSLVSRAR